MYLQNLDHKRYTLSIEQYAITHVDMNISLALSLSLSLSPPLGPPQFFCFFFVMIEKNNKTHTHIYIYIYLNNVVIKVKLGNLSIDFCYTFALSDGLFVVVVVKNFYDV